MKSAVSQRHISSAVTSNINYQEWISDMRVIKNRHGSFEIVYILLRAFRGKGRNIKEVPNVLGVFIEE